MKVVIGHCLKNYNKVLSNGCEIIKLPSPLLEMLINQEAKNMAKVPLIVDSTDPHISAGSCKIKMESRQVVEGTKAMAVTRPKIKRDALFHILHLPLKI